MTQSTHSTVGRRPRLLAGIAVLTVCAISAVWWWPRLTSWAVTPLSGRSAQSADGVGAAHDHTVAHHDEHAHAAADSLELSPAARLNLGLTAEYLQPVELSTYHRRITVPAVVTARPGRTQIQVSTPLTGVVTHVHAVTGEAVTAGSLLFEIRLTHEELVTAQTDLLKSLGELDVEQKEIARLEGVAESGAISGRSLLERRYSRDRLEASIRAQREALKLHGLSDRQVDEIVQERKLLRSLQITVPDTAPRTHAEELRLSRAPSAAVPVAPVSLAGAAQPDQPLPAGQSSGSRRPPLILEHLAVSVGQAVRAGDTLCVVADLGQLFIEGQAFDQDAAAINRAAENDWRVTAVFPDPDGDQVLEGLQIAFVGTEVDLQSRSLAFFVDLPNQVTRDVTNAQGQRYLSWKYRPGQRLQLQVPVEEWREQIVLPVEAVVREGADWFVFQQNGSRFDRIAVHVQHRDQAQAVIASDGAIFPGDVIARRAAHQMQMALKNKSGAGVDPHAGHSH